MSSSISEFLQLNDPKTTTNIRVRNNNGGYNDVYLLLDFLSQCYEHVKVFHMSGFMLPIYCCNDINEALKRCHRLEDVDLYENNLLSCPSNINTNLISSSTLYTLRSSLRVLNLSHYIYDDHGRDNGAELLSKFLRETSTLENVDLFDSEISDDIFANIMNDGIAKNRSIQHLSIGSTLFQFGGGSMRLDRIAIFNEALVENRTIQHLWYIDINIDVNWIKMKRNQLRRTLNIKRQYVSLYAPLPPEMIQIVIHHMDTHVQFIHGKFINFNMGTCDQFIHGKFIKFNT